jgi:hypothetical protein
MRVVHKNLVMPIISFILAGHVGCTGSNANSTTGDTSSSLSALGGGSGTAVAAAGPIAAKLGVKEEIVQAGIAAAQSYLNKSQTKEPADKDAAAQSGVDAATAKAKELGQELKPEQASGLLASLKGML